MIKKELSYEQHVQEFLEEMKKRKVVSLYGSYFSDDPYSNKESKYRWYQKECKKLAEEFQTNATISEERMKEIIEFAEIEKYIKENLKKKKMTVLEKASEYREKVLELSRDIKVADQLYFSNGNRMAGWLYKENIRIKEILESNNLLTKEEIEEIDALGELNFLINEIFLKKQRLSFDEKAKEYLEKLYDIGRDIEKKDKICFTNGESMSGWLEIQVKNLRIMRAKKGFIDEHRFSVLSNIFDCKKRLWEESRITSTYDAYLDQYASDQINGYLKESSKELAKPKIYKKK